jgi:hypothetical protein
MAHLHELVEWLGKLTGMDDWILVGILFVVAGFVGKATVKAALGLATGSRLKVGDLATDLLKLLEDPSGWVISNYACGEVMLNVAGRERNQNTRVSVDPKNRDVEVNGQSVLGLNRRERGLLFMAARTVRDSIKAATKDKIYDEARGAVSLARANR